MRGLWSGTYLGVTPNVELSLGGVDLLTGEVAQFDLHLYSQRIISAAILVRPAPSSPTSAHQPVKSSG